YLCCLFNDTSTPQIYTLSLHDALPILADMTIGIGLEEIADFDPGVAAVIPPEAAELEGLAIERLNLVDAHADPDAARSDLAWRRSEEHTSELQSRENLVCRLLLEKKKQ